MLDTLMYQVKYDCFGSYQLHMVKKDTPMITSYVLHLSGVQN